MISPAYLLDPRELRLRRRIDSLLASRAAKEQRILQLEELLRRLIELSEELREARRVA